MKRIFVSHDNRDKPALRPFLHALFDAGFTLFVDRPTEVGLDATDPRIVSIQTTESWQDGLERGLRECDIVLVFWTPNSVGKSAVNAGSVILTEVIMAFTQNKLRCALLCDDPADVPGVVAGRPTLLKDLQHIDLSGSDRAAIAADLNFRNLVHQLSQAPAAVAAPEAPDLVPRFRAKLVNRQKPVRELIAAGTVTAHYALDQADGPRARGVIVIGSDFDRLEFLGDRFVARDGAACFSTLPSGAADTRLWASMQAWNDHRMTSLDDEMVTPDSFAAHMRYEHQAMQRKKPLRDGAGQYPVLATIRLNEQAIRDDPEGVIAAWLAAWDEELARPVDIPVLPVLYIGYAEEKRGLFSFFSRPPRERVQEAAEAALARTPLRHLEARLSPPLDRINYEIANNWVRDHFTDDLRDVVDDLVTDVFPRKGSSPALLMADFYKQIIRMPPFSSGHTA